MSKVIDGAVKALNERLGGGGFDGSVRFDIEGEGSILVDGGGARANDADADCVVSASRETFEGLLEGEINATSAFMTGKLRIDGDMGQAMKLGSLLS
ncbi:MAG: SCP2 sterol-binding domain-containing protein [Maritimibacter sp.]|nr:SCP2 sterol-binding domain-containing protein [Maritimibacter sp.]MCB1351846.1 SCP2 sterol-binding domain-containing protein [Paracoccaceae bacterium]